MLRVLVTPPVTAEHKAKLESIPGCEFIYLPAEAATAELVRGVGAIFGNVAPGLLEGAGNLRLIQLFTAGADGYTEVLPKGCLLTNTTGAFGLAISEHMLGMWLALIKRLHEYRDNQSACTWQDMGSVTSVAGATVLVLGLGNIGGEFARKAKALGAYTIGVRRADSSVPEYMDEVHLASAIDGLIPRADAIAMALPGTPQTRCIMGRERIFAMKPGAVLLNVGRGAAVDTGALCDALEQGRILAGLDVTDPEPLPPGHRLWRYKNALVTPHISGFFHLAKTLDNMVDIAVHNIRALQSGGGFINIVDLSTGYRQTPVGGAV